MKKGLLIIVIGFTFLLGINTQAKAGIVNPGFENGFTGWNLSGSGSYNIVSSHSGNSITYLPQEGSKFLELKVSGYSTNVYQDVLLNQGEILSGWAAFDWRDYSPYNDGLSVRILNNLGSVIATPYTVSGGPTNYWDGPWVFWSWSAPSTGTYRLQYTVWNASDTLNDSYGLFDAASSVVPEPATMFLLSSGLLGLLGLSRRRKI